MVGGGSVVSSDDDNNNVLAIHNLISITWTAMNSSTDASAPDDADACESSSPASFVGRRTDTESHHITVVLGGRKNSLSTLYTNCAVTVTESLCHLSLATHPLTVLAGREGDDIQADTVTEGAVAAFVSDVPSL